MAGGIRGITVEIGGDTTKLGKALEGVNKNTRDLQKELKGVESLLKLDPGNTDLLAQRQEILKEAISETAEKLDILRKAQSQVEDQFAKGDIGADQYRDFQREIIATENKLEGFKAELNGTEGAVEDVGNAAEQSSDGFTIMGGALADLVASAITGAINAIGDLIGSLLELSEATEEYRTMQAKLEGSANTFGYSADFAKSKYEEFYKYLGDDKAATNAITNLMGVGTSTESLTGLVDGAAAAWATYGDSINVESLTEAISETVTCGKVTGSFADTINWCKDANENLGKALGGNKEAQKAYNEALEEGLPVEDAFNEALAKITDEQERADVVAKFLNDTYGESKKTYDETAGSILEANEAELQLKDTQAQLGETMQPVNTALTDMKNQALQAITPLVESLANGFMNLYNWLQKNPTVMTILTAVVIALATAFGVLATALAIQGLITGVTKAIAFLNTTLLANPIVLIVAAIAGLVAAFIYLWNNCEAFRNFWINLWNTVKTFCINAWNAIKAFFTTTVPQIVNNVATWFKQLPGKIWNAIIGAVSKVAAWGSNLLVTARSAASRMVSTVVSFVAQLPGRIYSAIQGAISRVVSWGSGLASAGRSAIQNMINNVVSIAKSIPSKFISIGRSVIEGIKSGISSAIGGLYSSIKSALSGLVNKAKEALGINSPSKVFANTIGIGIPEGIAKGIDDNADIAEASVQDMTDSLTDQALNLNGATINRKLSTTFVGTVGNTANSALLSKLDGIYERLNRLQIVLDTGTLVGETIDQIDAGLANRQLLSARGV